MMVRAHWRIGELPIGNLIHLLESKGVRVYSLAEQGKSLDAFSLWHQNIPFVFLKTNKTAEHSRMDAAHELGHLVLHRHIFLNTQCESFGPSQPVLASSQDRHSKAAKLNFEFPRNQVMRAQRIRGA